MGKRDPQAPLWNYRVNLDKQVRGDLPLRRINEALDLKFRERASGANLRSGDAINQRGPEFAPRPRAVPVADAGRKIVFCGSLECELRQRKARICRLRDHE